MEMETKKWSRLRLRKSASKLDRRQKALMGRPPAHGSRKWARIWQPLLTIFSKLNIKSSKCHQNVKTFHGKPIPRHGKIMSCATFQIQGTLWVQPLLGKKRRPGDFKRDPEEMWECSPIPATGYAGIQGFGGFRLVKTFNCFYGLIRDNYKWRFTPPY